MGRNLFTSSCGGYRSVSERGISLRACGHSSFRWSSDGTHRSPHSALRVARDRPFRAGARSPHRPRAFRAKMNMVSTPALHPFGSCGPRLRRPRRTWLRRGERGMRWPLAPGGSLEDSLRSSSKPCLAALGETARGAGWVTFLRRALARAPRGARRRERERADGSVGRCRRGNPRCWSIAVSGA